MTGQAPGQLAYAAGGSRKSSPRMISTGQKPVRADAGQDEGTGPNSYRTLKSSGPTSSFLSLGMAKRKMPPATIELPNGFGR